jgi:5'-3' exonuclease
MPWALLISIGSDYTEGVAKVGTVTALEIVSAFPGNEGLAEFVKLMEHPDLDSLPKEQITPDMGEKLRVVSRLSWQRLI